MLRKIFSLSTLVLLTALTLSAIAAWYSILGLVAIFAAAALPIIIMGSSLEFAKVVTTIWLHKYWKKTGYLMKTYLTIAVISLAFLTSMGIFGFLSKAHIDQGVPTSDVQAQVNLIDERIANERNNIKIARETLAQLDRQVNETLNRTAKQENNAGVNRSITIRRQQAKERASLQKEIETATANIRKLNEEKMPIASNLRKVEAEVGPIKYIAALIYGDNPDQNILEKAVRWVIILIIFVFDPLALTLVLASNSSRKWDDESIEESKVSVVVTELPKMQEVAEVQEGPQPVKKPEPSIFSMDDHPYLKKEWNGFKSNRPQPKLREDEPIIQAYLNQEWKGFTQGRPQPVLNETSEPKIKQKPRKKKTTSVDVEETSTTNTDVEILQHKATQGHNIKLLDNEYVMYQGKKYAVPSLKKLHPELFLMKNEVSISTNFGIAFPSTANKGDIFVRVDMLPNRVYKFDGNKWIETNKNNTSSYLDNQYIEFLIDKVNTGEYDIESLSDNERFHIEQYLTHQK